MINISEFADFYKKYCTT